MVVAAEDLSHSALVELLEHLLTQPRLNVEVDLVLVGSLHEPGNVLEDHGVLAAEPGALLKLLLEPSLVSLVEIGDILVVLK